MGGVVMFPQAKIRRLYALQDLPRKTRADWREIRKLEWEWGEAWDAALDRPEVQRVFAAVQELGKALLAEERTR